MGDAYGELGRDGAFTLHNARHCGWRHVEVPGKLPGVESQMLQRLSKNRARMRGIIHAAHQNLLNVLPNRLFTTTNGAREGAEKGREYIEGAVGAQAAPLPFLT